MRERPIASRAKRGDTIDVTKRRLRSWLSSAPPAAARPAPIYALTPILFLLGFAFSSFAQVTHKQSDPVDSWQIIIPAQTTISNRTLKVVLPRNVTRGVDDFVDLELSVQNIDHQIFPGGRPPFMTCFKVEIYDAATNRVEKTDLGQKRWLDKESEPQLRGPRLIWVEPGRPHIERFRLSDYSNSRRAGSRSPYRPRIPCPLMHQQAEVTFSKSPLRSRSCPKYLIFRSAQHQQVQPF